MAKKFMSDARFDKRRHREQRDVVVMGKQSRSIGAPEAMRVLHEKQVEAAQAQREQEWASSRRRERIGNFIGDMPLANSYSLDVISARSLQAMEAAFLRAAQVAERTLPTLEEKVAEALATFEAGNVSGRLFRDVQDFVEAHRDVLVSVYPEGALAELERQSPATHKLVTDAASACGVVFAAPGDVTLMIIDHYGGYGKRLNLTGFMEFCKKRANSNYMFAQRMAANSVSKAPRRTRLD